MAKPISSAMQKQIQELRLQGFSLHAIANALGKERRVIRRYLPDDDPHKIHSEVKPSRKDQELWHLSVHWELVREEQKKGVPINVLWKEHAPTISYSQFWRHLRKQLPARVQPTLFLEHQPAQKVQVDYVEGIDIVDRNSGEITETHLFCGVLPFSSYTFGEFVLSQKKESFLSSHQKMFSFFGGVTPYVIVDNLKSGVAKAHRYDPDANPAYCDLGNHYGFAVLPARPRKPRDKPSVESAAGLIQRSFYATVRNRTFYSLPELNGAFREYLQDLNGRIMKDYGVSRADRFAKEKPLLKPLPETPFEIADWKHAKVHPDCHIQFEKNFYSVPFQWTGSEVRVRFTEKTVTIFGEDSEALACHARVEGVHRHSTQMAHYPPEAANVAFYNVDQAKREAAQIGGETKGLVDHLLDRPYPLQYLRRVQGIVRLIKSGRVSKEALEHACKTALSFKNTRLAYIQQVAQFYQTHGAKPVLVRPLRDTTTLFLHHPERKDSHDGTNPTDQLSLKTPGAAQFSSEKASGGDESGSESPRLFETLA